MKIKTFKEIIAWQRAHELTVALYQRFRENKDFAFKDQILRAVLSIMNNIAEGFERQTDKEFVYFLHIAKGSATEVRSMLVIAQDLGYITTEQFETFDSMAVETTKITLRPDQKHQTT